MTDTLPDFLVSFARQRHHLLHQAGEILGVDGRDGDGGGLAHLATDGQAVPKLSQLLMASLEVLKVVEESMIEQCAVLLGTRGELERTVSYYRTLFDLAPAALLLTTTEGSVRASNRAAAALLLRDAYHLDGKPVSGLVPRELRTEFRKQLNRISVTAGVSNWRITLERPTDAPITVLAAVHMVPSTLTGSAALYWYLRPAD